MRRRSRLRAAAVIAGALMVALVASPSAGAAIGPDALGYTADTVAFDFEDISATGTPFLSNDDDTTVELSMPFAFEFYGASYDSVLTSPNGVLTFGSAHVSYVNFDLGALGTAAPTVAVLWDDWTTWASDADVYYATLGDPGSRRFVVQWHVVQHYPSGSLPPVGTATFQAVLYEGSNDIEFRYLDTSTEDEFASGVSATVGIADTEGPANGRYLQWSYDEAVIASESAIRFTAPSLEDTTKPTITITTPPDDATYLLGESVLADYACADETGGSGLASCQGTVPSGAAIGTATVGAKTFSVTATDNAGNTDTLTHDYTVAYPFAGFFAPIDNDGVYNVVRAGQGIPVKFSLGGDYGLNIIQAASPSTVACDSTSPTDAVETTTAGASGLSYDPISGVYTYTWKTDKAWANTCRKLTVTLIDGTSHSALFKLTR